MIKWIENFVVNVKLRKIYHFSVLEMIPTIIEINVNYVYITERNN